MKDPITFKAEITRYDNPNLYRRCGRSGILLPAVSLGLWKNFGATRPFIESRQMLHFAFDHGITHFDLANNYGPPYGSAEETFGRVIETSFAPYRDELFISTKAGYDMWPGPYGNWGSRKYLISSLEQSLKRMHLEYVDLFYIHRYDPYTPLDETLQALVDIVRTGKALYIGISRWPLEATTYGLKYLREHDVPCLCYQGRLNMLDNMVEKEGILDLLRKEQCGFVSFSPLAQGLLTDRYIHGIPKNSRMRQETTLKESTLTTEFLQRLTKLAMLAAQRGDTVAQLALRWVLSHKGTTSVIIGASSTQQIKDNLRVADGELLTKEEMDRINNIFDLE